MYKIPDVNIPLYWIRPQQMLSTNAGMQRFLWDFHYEPLNESPSYPIAAVKNNTAPDPTSPWAMPGTYTVRLKVNGQVQEQKFNVVMDPRVKTSLKDLQRQHDLSMICYEGKKLTAGKNPPLYRRFNALFEVVSTSDMAPTSQTEKAIIQAQQELSKK
jgi:hypothetical protein